MCPSTQIGWNSIRSCDSDLLSLLPFGAQFLMNHARASSTLSSLASECRTFRTFCRLAGITHMPVSGSQLVIYATWLVATGRITSAESLKQYLSAVSSLHKWFALSCPTPTQYGPLQNVIQGFRRVAQRKVKKSLTVTPPILINLLNSISPTPASWLQSATLFSFRTFTLILYLSMLRSANLVPGSRSKIDYLEILTWDKIHRVAGGLVISVLKSKTIQFGERIQQIPLATGASPQLCPVAALDGLAEMYGVDTCGRNTPVFRLPPDAGGWTPKIKADYVPFFRARLASMGLNPTSYSLHGFRHGSIQECLLSETNLGLCQITSDHASSAILTYAEVPPARRLSISSKISTSLARFLHPAGGH